MATTHWRINVTIESSAKQRVEQLAQADNRSIANYVRVLLERDVKEKEPAR